MPEMHPTTENMLELGRAMLERDRAARKSNVIPVGEQKMTAEETRKKLDTDASFRQEMLQRDDGRETILRLYRPKGGR